MATPSAGPTGLHWLPVASIPPPEPPEQDASADVSIFALRTGSAGGFALRGKRPSVVVAAAICGPWAVALVDRLPLDFKRGWSGVAVVATMRATTGVRSAGSSSRPGALHWFPVASMPPLAPPEQPSARAPTQTTADNKQTTRKANISISGNIQSSARARSRHPFCSPSRTPFGSLPRTLRSGTARRHTFFALSASRWLWRGSIVFCVASHK